MMVLADSRCVDMSHPGSCGCVVGGTLVRLCIHGAVAPNFVLFPPHPLPHPTPFSPLCFHSSVFAFWGRRYGRADKLSKMPQWISQYLRGDLLNMSIVEATQLARRFFHDMAKPMTARMESSIDMDLSRALYVPGPPVVEGPGVGGEGPGPLGVDGPSTALGGVGLGGSASDVGALGPLAGAGGPGGGPLSSAGGGGSGLAAGLPQGDGSRVDAPAAATSAFSLSAPAPPSKRLRLTTE